MLPDPAKKFNSRQREAINKPQNRPLLIVAGAGSGKTATLTGRFAALLSLGVPAENIVAITFTNKAADEMRSRLLSSGASLVAPDFEKKAFVGTFHSFGAKILRSEARLVGRSPNFTIFDSSDSARLLRRLIKSLNIDKKEYGYSFFAGRASDIKNNLLDPVVLLKSSSLKDRLAADVYSRYELALRENNGFDFDDLIEKIVFIFRRFPETLQKYQRRHTHLLIDEYQDTNRAQYTLVKILAGDRGNLNVVGDDNQAIYGFRGADFRNFLNFDRDFKDTEVVVLDQNYRSTGHIIKSASALIKNNIHQRPKNLWTENEDGELINLSEHDVEESEAGWLAAAARPFLKSGESIAVIYRTNAQSRSLEQAFIKEGISYQIFGGLKFYERKEIKDLVAALAFAHNPSDSLSYDRIMKNFYKKQARELLSSLPDKAKILPPAELLTYIINSSDFLPQLEKNFENFTERSENVSELISFASSFTSLSEFLEAVSLFQSSDSAPGAHLKNRRDEILNQFRAKNSQPDEGMPSGLSRRDGNFTAETGQNNARTIFEMNSRRKSKNISGLINLMTIHLSKGLEFDNVFVVGVSEGLLPHAMSYHDDGGIEEERRLMYVAMTRAKKRLFLSFYRLPSRFLSEIPSEHLRFENGLNLNDLDSEDRYISI